MKKRICIALLLMIALLTGTLFSACTQEDIDNAVFVIETLDAIMDAMEEQKQTSSPIAEGSTGFEAHFIDVGQADCTLVICDGETLLIDGGNVEDSSLIVSYISNLGIEHLDYVVCTHGHEDHVGGLSGPLNAFTAGHVLCSVDNYDSKAFEDFKRYTNKQGLEIEIPEVGDTFQIGSAVVRVLGPQQEYSDTNNMSVVLRITYGETAFLFTGDAEAMAEEDIVDSGAVLSSTLLQVGHHGSETSTSYQFLREVMPEYAVISVGEDNSYGHPHDVILSRLEDAGCQVYRTDEQGHIIAQSDGKTITIYTEK